MPDQPAEPEFEVSRKSARRAQMTLNVLVILSAVSASVFFVYVLHNLRPFGERQPPEVNVPTSSIGKTIALLRTEQDATLELELRDVDEAPEYRNALSDAMRKSMAISQSGRLYRLRVHNAGKQPLDVKSPRISVRDRSAADWNVRWLAEVAEAGNATPTGRLTLGQSAAEFTLQPGETRQLVVFIAGNAPPAEEFSSADFTADHGLKIALNRQEVKVSTP